jgi:hypothetical protein
MQQFEINVRIKMHMEWCRLSLSDERTKEKDEIKKDKERGGIDETYINSSNGKQDICIYSETPIKQRKHCKINTAAKKRILENINFLNSPSPAHKNILLTFCNGCEIGSHQILVSIQ